MKKSVPLCKEGMLTTKVYLGPNSAGIHRTEHHEGKGCNCRGNGWRDKGQKFLPRVTFLSLGSVVKRSEGKIGFRKPL